MVDGLIMRLLIPFTTHLVLACLRSEDKDCNYSVPSRYDTDHAGKTRSGWAASLRMHVTEPCSAIGQIAATHAGSRIQGMGSRLCGVLLRHFDSHR
jgi:hypothetical protein